MPASPTYQIEIRHDGLHKYRLIKGTDRYVVQQKATAQQLAWNETWLKKMAAEDVRSGKQKAAKEKESKKALAAEGTIEAQEVLAGLERTLLHTLEINDSIEWDSLIDRTPFSKRAPATPQILPYPKEPTESDEQFKPVKKWYYVILPGLLADAELEATNKFKLAYGSWQRQVADVDESNKRREEEYRESLCEWQKEKTEFEEEQAEQKATIFQKKAAYFERDSQAIMDYCDIVLSRSQYPDTFPQEWNLEYQKEARTIVVDYFLPSPEDLPRLKEVKYIPSKDEFVEIFLQEPAFNKIYDNLLYQIALRTIHELYESDQINALSAVGFNGWVRSIDKGTGKPITVCVLSVHAPRDEFNTIDLKRVEAKICFKNLKGVGSSKLHGLSPIAPIIQLSKEDKRFVSSYSVVGDVDKSTNLASMDWEDFEHLIREVFEKEFSQNGGEVQITQASRDAGVDAIAFDPDPIRGGKIVIQAKRYTNTVELSAVRDLYGTVMNEGATKGILVTTADYGPDAYGFAKGKPLTLLSGSNLLHLLEKHGHKASIDLKAAKQILADQKKADRINR
jgi:restriction system protein